MNAFQTISTLITFRKFVIPGGRYNLSFIGYHKHGGKFMVIIKTITGTTLVEIPGVSNLKFHNFKDQKLALADFSHEVLTRTEFHRADLAGADFRRTRLDGVSFIDADLTGADFRWADVSGADFTRATLAGANFRGAIYATPDDQVCFESAKLSGRTVLPNGIRWGEYLNELVPTLLTAGGRPLSEVATPETWGNHETHNCPMTTAFGVRSFDKIPALYYREAELFSILFDAGLIPMPAPAPIS